MQRRRPDPVPARGDRILVIKLGALGDIVQATGPFAAIRAHHPDAHITLLTTAPYAGFLRDTGWFDAVDIDTRPGWWQPGAWLALRRRLRAGGFGRVYDLQTSNRSSFYYRLFLPGRAPQWSGIAAGCSHPHANPRRDDMHTAERQAEQLAMAGIAAVPAPSLDWVAADAARYGLPERYALLVAGGSAHRPDKRWPAGRFAQLARRLADRGVTPVLIGTAAEGEVNAMIATFCATARDLTGETGFADIVALARGAAGAVGNDTGPMHLIAAAGAPSLVLFSQASNPDLCAPHGAAVTIVRRPVLADLAVDEVEAALRLR
jgi:ADP-heptose:LPS heptosyltransferase